MKDAYQLLNEARDLWQQNALANNDASNLNKDKRGIDLWCRTPCGWHKIESVKFDPRCGIVMDYEK